MVFSSNLFLFVFLPVFLAGYYALPTRARMPWIIAGSYAFYAWWRLDALALLVGLTAWTYLWSRRIDRARCTRQAARATAIGVGGALALLATFKYAGFAARTLGLGPLDILLPIGISFYTFQAISFLVDRHRGDARPARSLLDLAGYLALFPQLIAGPIVRYKDVADQLVQREHSLARFGEGARRFMIGFAMKVVVADTVAPIADASFAQPAAGAALAWLGALAYTAQIFYDFAGYSHMAIGLGAMLGFRFPENFDAPYRSHSISEFWRRWHITLSSWMRDYLYIPLGGNRRGALRTGANLAATMLLAGLWHGAAWTFVVWGAWHGAWLIGERLVRGDARRRDDGGAARVLLTMLVVVIGWVVFRAPDLASAGRHLVSMAGANGAGTSALRDVLWQVSNLQLVVLAGAFAAIYLRPLHPRRHAVAQAAPTGRAAAASATTVPSSGSAVPAGDAATPSSAAAGPTAAVPPSIVPDAPGARLSAHAARIALCAFFLLAVAKLTAERFSPFLYFRF